MVSSKRMIVFVSFLVMLVLLQNLSLIARLFSEGASGPNVLETPEKTPGHRIPPVYDHISNESGNNIISTSSSALIHLTIYGLGHRLVRTTAAWHLAQRLGVSHFKFQWGTCGKDHSSGPSIFPYLFGSDRWNVPHSNHTETRNPTLPDRNVLVRNDVYGYLPSQSFQDHAIPIPSSWYSAAYEPLNPRIDDSNKVQNYPFRSKVESDVWLYRQMRERFVFSNELVEPFLKEHDFAHHLVIGVHLRAGNGEVQHFSYAGRQIMNETQFVEQLASLLQRFLLDVKPLGGAFGRPPLLFLATDTPYLIPVLSNATASFGLPTVVLPQLRLEDHKGVTFSALQGAGQKCLLGWQAMVADMILLSHSNVLLAARHSSFTQSMPMSLVLHTQREERGPHMCEVSENATTMSCFQDMPSWLFRKDPTKEWMFQVPSQGDTNEGGGSKQTIPVAHKSLIFLPEPQASKDLDETMTFLHSKRIDADAGDGTVPTHTHGSKRFNPKYRQRKPLETPVWNITSVNTKER